jgi:hypothetical protein
MEGRGAETQAKNLTPTLSLERRGRKSRNTILRFPLLTKERARVRSGKA